VVIPRTTIPFTSNPMFTPDGGNIQNLATVGPIHVDGLCRHTFAGSNGQPGPGGGGGSGRKGSSGLPNREHYPAPFFTGFGGEDEAQVIVWIDPSAGSLTFKGAHGKRHNVPPGPPDYTTEITGASPNAAAGLVPPGGSNTDRAHSPEPNGPVTNVPNPVAGEGDHLFLAVSNETVDENRATDPEADNQADPTVRKLNRYPAVGSGNGIIATSDGHFATASFIAGFDVLGAYDSCVFAGVVHPFS